MGAFDTGNDDVRLEVFRQAALDTDLSERAIIRMPSLVKAAIGFSSERRDQAIGLARGMLQSSQRQTNPGQGYPNHWRTTALAAALAAELQPDDDEFRHRIAAQLLERMRGNRSLWVLGMLSEQLIKYADTLSQDEVLAVLRTLRDGDFQQRSSMIPPRMLEAFPAMAEHVDDKHVAAVMSRAIDDWKRDEFWRHEITWSRCC